MKHLFTILFILSILSFSATGQLTPGTAGANQSISYNTVPQPLTATPPTGGTAPYAYKWQSSINNNVFYNIQGATALTYQPAALTASTWYRQVQYSATPGDSAITNVVAIQVYGMGVAETNAVVQAVYPNPTSGMVTIGFREGLDANKVTMDLFNSAGTRLFLTRIPNDGNKKSFSLSGKPAGIYFLKFTIGDLTETVRIIKE